VADGQFWALPRRRPGSSERPNRFKTGPGVSANGARRGPRGDYSGGGGHGLARASARCSRRRPQQVTRRLASHPVDAEQRVAVDHLAPVRTTRSVPGPASAERRRPASRLHLAVLDERPFRRVVTSARTHSRGSRSRPPSTTFDWKEVFTKTRTRHRSQRIRASRRSDPAEPAVRATYFLRLVMTGSEGKS